MRKTIFTNDEYYHIYNRGVDKRDVFMGDEDYARFITSMREFNVVEPIGSLYEKGFRDKKHEFLGAKSPIGDLAPKNAPESALVEIVAYCLNPNHFHLILKQRLDGGISKFMLKLSSGYSSYFNKKNKRSGSLFQGPFKSIHIDSNEYLLHLSAYVNKNNFVHGYENLGTKSPIGDLVPKFAHGDMPDCWKYSSYLDYVGKRDGKLCDKEIILSQFGNKEEYADFMDRTGDYFRDKKEIERYLLE